MRILLVALGLLSWILSSGQCLTGTFKGNGYFVEIDTSLLYKQIYISKKFDNDSYSKGRLIRIDSTTFKVKYLLSDSFEIDVVELQCNKEVIDNNIVIELINTPWTVDEIIYQIGLNVGEKIYKLNREGNFYFIVPKISFTDTWKFNLKHLSSGVCSRSYSVKDSSSNYFLISIDNYDKNLNYFYPPREVSDPWYADKLVKIRKDSTIEITEGGTHTKILRPTNESMPEIWKVKKKLNDRKHFPY